MMAMKKMINTMRMDKVLDAAGWKVPLGAGGLNCVRRVVKVARVRFASLPQSSMLLWMARLSLAMCAK